MAADLKRQIRTRPSLTESFANSSTCHDSRFSVGGQRRIGPAAGQRRIGSAAKQQVRRCKKRRAAAEHFVDDAAGEAAAGSEVAELCAARAPGSQDRPDNRCSTSQGSMASSEGDLDSEDAYPAEDWAALEQAAAGAAYTDALSDDSLSEQESELCADRPQHDVDVSQQAVSPRRHDLAARPDEEHRAGGNAPPRPVPAAGERFTTCLLQSNATTQLVWHFSTSQDLLY